MIPHTHTHTTFVNPNPTPQLYFKHLARGLQQSKCPRVTFAALSAKGGLYVCPHLFFLPFGSDVAEGLRVACLPLRQGYLGPLVHLPLGRPVVTGRSKPGGEKRPACNLEQYLAGVRNSVGRALGSREPRTKQAKNSLP